MNGGPSIIGLRAADADPLPASNAAAVEEALGLEESWEWEDAPDRAPTAWRLGAVALAVLSGAWVAWLTYLAWHDLPVMSASALASFAAGLVAVPALAGIVWLLALRTSRAEAAGFNKSARAMREEAAALDRTIAALGNTVDERSAQLAEHLRLLTVIGDAAAERLASIGRGLAEEIDQADVHARALGETAGMAQRRLERLLDHLPGARDGADAMGLAIERAGSASAAQMAALEARLVGLTGAAGAAEATGSAAAATLATHLARMEATTEAAAARLDAVTSATEQAVDALLARTADAVDESRRGIAAQGEAMLAMVNANQTALDHAAREGATALATRIDVIEQVIERIAARLDAQTAASRALFDTLDHGARGADERIALLHRDADTRVQQLAASIAALTASAEASATAIDGGETAARGAIATSEALLTALDAVTREMDETLPASFARLDANAARSRETMAAIKPELMALLTASESSHDAVDAIAKVIAEQRRNTETLAQTLLATLADGRTRAEAIVRVLDEASERAEQVHGEAAPRLLETLQRVRESASIAADRSREAIGAIVPQVADALRQATGEALAGAMNDGVEARIAELSAAAERAARGAAAASEAIDARVAALDAATRRAGEAVKAGDAAHEEREREGFARRASALIEALNSAAIDLTHGFAPDVADTAWGAYLKGDRGIFTRRAVRAVNEAGESEVLRLYDADAGFRAQVNRYVHDFEAMLRHVLAEREGSALGVTLLSSDMGKLYVSLAQAIQRLR